jgi:sigma54-dependent transcription regulator
MEQVLISWIGVNDLKGTGLDTVDFGPIHNTLSAQSFDRVELLYNYPSKDVKPYLQWLKQQISVDIKDREIRLSSPIHFGEIYKNTNSLLAELTDNNKCDLHILLSPGTPAMQAVWILLAKTRYPATF